MNTWPHVVSLYAACGVRPRALLLHSLLGAPPEDLNKNSVQLERWMVAGRVVDDLAHQRKMRRLQKLAPLISALPFVRAVAICNSLALHTTHVNSDIDLLIVSAPGRVWSARWFVSGFLSFLRLRPGETRCDPICASFFVEENCTDWSWLALREDLYWHYWQRSALPIIGQLPWLAATISPEFSVRTPWVTFVRTGGEKLVSWLPERWLRTQQEKIMPPELLTAAELPNTNVVLSDQVIKLHANDRRQDLRERAAAWRVAHVV